MEIQGEEFLMKLFLIYKNDDTLSQAVREFIKFVNSFYES